jgi:hypothetical protein
VFTFCLLLSFQNLIHPHLSIVQECSPQTTTIEQPAHGAKNKKAIPFLEKVFVGTSVIFTPRNLPQYTKNGIL